MSWGIRRHFYRLSPCDGQVAYVLLTRAPVAGCWRQASNTAAPRLACVKPVASVHPEPGSNSSLFSIFVSLFLKLLCWHSPISNDRTASPARLPRPGIRQYHLLVFQELTKELFRLTAMKADRTLALVLLYFVYCKLFNVLFSGFLPRSFGEERKTMQS